MNRLPLSRSPSRTTLSGSQCFLLLDGIVLEPLERWLYEAQPSPDYEPLYLDTPLARCRKLSPCLVAVSIGDPTYTRFLEEAAITEAGWLLTSKAPLATLADHLRGLLFVDHPWHGEQILRLASPKVMRYLFEAEEQPSQSVLLGPIETLWLPEAEGGELRWSRIINERGTSTVCAERFILGERHCQSLSRIAWQRFRHELAMHLTTHFHTGPLLAKAGGAQGGADRVIEATRELGFSGRRAHFYMANILGQHGVEALDKTVMPELASLLSQPNAQPAMQRLKSAVALAHTLSNQEVST